MTAPSETAPAASADLPRETSVHPTAIVSAEATLGEGVTVGPGCIIEGPVVIGDGVNLIAHVHITGDTHIGAHSTIYPYACIGFGPQHVKVKPGDPIGGVRMGAHATLREHTTIHAAMHPGENTVLGERAYLMVGAHIGHDSIVGDDVIICNSALIAGHCEIHDNAYISGNCAIHQFCRVGRNAMMSGGNATSIDIPPYAILASRNELAGLNLVGMRRAGIARKDITLARAAYRRAMRRGITRADQLAILEELAQESETVEVMAEFVRTSKRGMALDRRTDDTKAADSSGDADGVA